LYLPGTMKKIEIIIPCFNEEKNIVHILSEVSKSVESLGYDCSLLFVDDGSTDKTAETIRETMQNRKDIDIIRFSRNFGKEAAIAAALHHCKADAAIIIDADLQHPPGLIPEMITEWENGSDIVDAIKIKRQKGNFLKNFTSISFNKLMSFLTDMDFSDASDFKLLSRKAIRIINLLDEKSRFFRGLTNWIGLKHSTIEFETQERMHGKTKWNWIKLFQLSLDAITSYSSKPLHVVTFFGIGTFLFSFFLGIQTLYNKLFGHAVTGFTTVIVIILLFSSIIMISIGILGLYLSKIFAEVKNRPIFIIDNDNLISDRDSNPLEIKSEHNC
jgi:polyisoprenyl-phosphate glycosyltransferase